MSFSTTRPFWNSLPPEIRLLILGWISLNLKSKETIRASSLATVSREWQSFFERKTFRLIALASPDLPAFSKAVRGKNAIRLAEYTKRIYDKPESATNIKENNRAFTSDMTVLPNSLSSWEETRGGLVLEINAHSPSDQIFHPSEGEVHDDYPIRFKEDLKDWSSFWEYLREKRAARIASIAVPRSVRRGFTFDQSSRWDSFRYASAPKKFEGLARIMATACHRFTEFSPPIMFECYKFLWQLAHGEKNKESKLQHLTLRTCHLHSHERPKFVTNFLVIAARAVMKLPRIRILEIWNSGPGFGFLFRCTQDSHRAIITWRSTESEFVLTPKTIRAWTRVASRRPLAIESIPFTEADGNGMGFNVNSINRHLALRRLAIDPITEAQLVAAMAL
ncbi:hypothetical protein NCS52_00107200 [Fusarium sp. LHS14.1]|nr:hypothetical protein NCS52_00107200 [Fusarium sp. LHS14.1]